MIEAISGLLITIIGLAIIVLPAGCMALLIISLTKKGRGPKRYNHKYKRQNHAEQYQTGWTWNDETKLWEPPEHLRSRKNEEPDSTTNPEIKEDKLNYQNAYQARQLFTKNEWQNYKKLRDIAEIKGYVICPKVRLLDIIEPRKGTDNYMAYLGKIKSKHVDFVICDKDMHIKAIIELDDNSHNNPDRKERDKFVNEILRSVGYKIIHTKYINNDILDLV